LIAFLRIFLIFYVSVTVTQPPNPYLAGKREWGVGSRVGSREWGGEKRKNFHLFYE